MPSELTKKKLMFIIPSLKGGGAEKILIAIMGLLSPEKYDMHLVVFEKTGIYVSSVPPYVKIHDLQKKSRYSFPALIVRLALLFNRIKPRTAVGFMSYANLVAILARFLVNKNMKLIATEHIHLSSQLNHERFGRQGGVFYKTFYRFSDVCIVPSKGVGQDLVDSFNCRNEKIKIIPNPIDPNAINVLSGEEIKDGPPGKYILAAGRLTEQKGYTYLLRAYSLIRKDIDESLVILGEGEQKQGLQKLAEDLGIGQKVYFLGFQKNPYKFMRQASLFVLSSLWESFSLVIVEAMACGAPVIATDCPSGPGEIIENNVNGLLVPVADERALARTMLLALKDEGLRKKLAENGKKRAEAFGIKNILPQYEALL